MAGEALSPGQKVRNRYLFNGAVFTGVAALVLGRFAWVRPHACGTCAPARDMCRWGSRLSLAVIGACKCTKQPTYVPCMPQAANGVLRSFSRAHRRVF